MSLRSLSLWVFFSPISPRPLSFRIERNERRFGSGVEPPPPHLKKNFVGPAEILVWAVEG